MIPIELPRHEVIFIGVGNGTCNKISIVVDERGVGRRFFFKF